MQRGVRNAQLALAVAETEHENRVLRLQPAHARDERGIAVELDAGGMHRGLRVRRADHGGEAPFERGANRALRRGEGGAAVAWRDGTERGQVLLHRQQLDPFERQSSPSRKTRTAPRPLSTRTTITRPR